MSYGARRNGFSYRLEMPATDEVAGSSGRDWQRCCVALLAAELRLPTGRSVAASSASGCSPVGRAPFCRCANRRCWPRSSGAIISSTTSGGCCVVAACARAPSGSAWPRRSGAAQGEIDEWAVDESSADSSTRASCNSTSAPTVTAKLKSPRRRPALSTSAGFGARARWSNDRMLKPAAVEMRRRGGRRRAGHIGRRSRATTTPGRGVAPLPPWPRRAQGRSSRPGSPRRVRRGLAGDDQSGTAAEQLNGVWEGGRDHGSPSGDGIDQDARRDLVFGVVRENDEVGGPR